MPYTKTTWVDEVPATTPIKYSVTDDVGGVIASSATIAIVTSVTAGTPINATNLNKHEDAIYDAVVAAEAAAVDAAAATADAAAATADAAAALAVVKSQVVEIQIVPVSVDVDGTSGIGYFFIPLAANGMNLIRATAMVDTAGTTGATTIQVRNLTKYASNDSLSTAISIASGGTIATAGTVNTSYDDVSTNDKIKVYITAVSTTKPKGLWVVLEYRLP